MPRNDTLIKLNSFEEILDIYDSIMQRYNLLPNQVSNNLFYCKLDAAGNPLSVGDTVWYTATASKDDKFRQGKIEAKPHKFYCYETTRRNPNDPWDRDVIEYNYEGPVLGIRTRRGWKLVNDNCLKI